MTKAQQLGATIIAEAAVSRVLTDETGQPALNILTKAAKASFVGEASHMPLSAAGTSYSAEFYIGNISKWPCQRPRSGRPQSDDSSTDLSKEYLTRNLIPISVRRDQ